MELDRKQLYHEYVQRENDFAHADYHPEIGFYLAVQQGDVHKVETLCHDVFANKEGLGILSLNPIRNLQYHFAITAAMLARYCIEAGMDMADSYSLSDFYIQQADLAETTEEINALHTTMSLAYTKKMKNLRKKKITSMPVARALDYIYEHLHTRITLNELAEHVQVNPAYLSRVFARETGMNVSEHIRVKKLETARNMLVSSDLNVSEIAAALAFSGQSYFTEQFRKMYGMTPLTYRRQNLFANNPETSTK